MYGINSEPPKNCFYCPLCQGEYGPGNEKSYCAIKSEVKLKYKGSRPKKCPIIVDPLPQWQIEFLKTLCEKARPQGEWIIKSNGTTNYYACNKCGNAGDIQDKFCRNCGAMVTAVRNEKTI